MLTKKIWEDSEKSFSDIVHPNEEIDKEIYDYFLGIMPPRKYIKNGFLMGEPFDSVEGDFRYMTFIYKDDKYFYKGLLTSNTE